jgi:outer membrane protein assembly factor BamB
VYFLYGTSDLAAFALDGKPLWSRNIGKDHGAWIVKFGYASSPLLYKGKLYVLVMQNQQPDKYPHSHSDRKPPLECYLLAIDPSTGRDLWRHVRPSDAFDESQETYNTPIPHEWQGRSEILIAGGDCVTGHHPETGKELWRWSYNPQKLNLWRMVPSLVAGDGLIFFATPRAKPLYAIKPGGRGTLTAADVAWIYEGPATDVCTPLYYKGLLYVLDGDKRVITCLDPKTGKEKWQGRMESKSVWRASPTGADGRIYCISEGGDAVVLALGEEFKELGRIPMGEGPVHSSIAVSGGRLFIRTAKALYCVSGAERR